MEQILTSKKIVERNLSIVKHINDKYVLFKDDNKTTVDNGNPNVSSVYGVTTIDKLISVIGDKTVHYLIDIPNDPKKNSLFRYINSIRGFGETQEWCRSFCEL